MRMRGLHAMLFLSLLTAAHGQPPHSSPSPATLRRCRAHSCRPFGERIAGQATHAPVGARPADRS